MSRLPIVGEEFAHYRVVSELGHGGFATVFGAVDLHTGEHVALKVLHADADSSYDDLTVQRFRREVKIVSKLTSPYTVRLHAYGEDRALWAAFELLPGRNLSAVLAELGTLAPGAVVHILRQVLTSLQEAHALGLIHRDLKPDNIRVFDGAEGPLTVKVLDFGIARATDPDAKVTGTGQLIGTPRYMSPEQLTAYELTPASDIYTVGLIGFELLYGAGALKGNSLLEQVERLADPDMFAQVGASAEQQHLTGVLRRMVIADIAQRTPTATAALHALDGRSNVAAPPPQRTWVPLVLVIAAVVILLGIVIAVFNPTTHDEPKVVTIQNREQLFTEPQRVEPQPIEPLEPQVVEPTEPEPVAELPPHCLAHDGPWPDADGLLYAYIPNSVAEAPFIFVTISEAPTDKLSKYLDYLSIRPHADARKFPVLSLSIHQTPAPETLGGQPYQNLTIIEKFSVLLVKLLREFQETCGSDTPVVLFGEGNGARRALSLARDNTNMFAATIVSGLRSSIGDRWWDHPPTMPLLAFGHTQDADAPWDTDRSRQFRLPIPRTTSWMYEELRRDMSCDGTFEAYADGACQRWNCPDAPLQTCKVEGGQWWDKSAATLLDDPKRFKNGGPVTNFPYHDVIWEFLDEALKD